MGSLFPVGQRVKLKVDVGLSDHKKAGDIGVVVEGRRGGGSANCVKFEGWAGGHDDAPANSDGFVVLKSGPFWYVESQFLEAVSFKVGDRVKITSVEPHDLYKVGDIGMVDRGLGPRRAGDSAWAVEIGGVMRCVYASQMEAAPLVNKIDKVAAPATGKFIVVSDEGPAEKPYVHTTRAAAEEEAKRLSKHVKLGVGFEVYHAVSRVFTPKPVAPETTIEALDKAA